MKILSVLLILSVFTSPCFAQSSYIDAWNQTSYSFENLFKEEGFENSQCQKSLKDFSACIEALNFLAKSLPEAYEINFDLESDSKVQLVTKAEETTAEEFEAMSPEEKEQAYLDYVKSIEDFQNLMDAVYNLEAPTSLEPLFAELYEKSKTIEQDIPFLAGHTFNIYIENAYDPASGFLPRSLMFREPNKYFGIGAEVAKKVEDPMTVIKAFKGSPAKAAGLKRGDKIISIDGNDISPLNVEEAVALVKGEEGSKVVFSVERFCSGNIEDVEVTRGPITQGADILEDSKFVGFSEFNADPKALECEGKPPVAGETQALYIPISSFPTPRSGERPLYHKFLELQLRDLNNPDSLGMIIDLRGNGGGDVTQTLRMLDSIIHQDELLLTYNSVEKGVLIGDKRNTFAHSDDVYFADSNNNPLLYKKPVVVLIDKQSASASEIFSGTIQDLKRGWVVGEKSFGKGSVQTLRPYPTPMSETLLKKTTAIYSLNSGRSPQRAGIIPDFWFSRDGEVPSEEDQDISAQSKAFNAIKGFKNIEWTQNRPILQRKISECTQAPDSLSQQYLENMKTNGLEAIKHAFPGYQNLLARDVLRCSLEVTPQLQE